MSDFSLITDACSAGTEKSIAAKRKRTQKFDVTFTEGLCDGWKFDVSEAFRTSLDIRYTPIVDKNTTKNATKTGKKSKPVIRHVWTRGLPPALAFERGQVFYDPPGVRGMTWNIALRILRRVLRIKDAVPDSYTKENGSIKRNGWVHFVVDQYERGRAVQDIEYRCSQAEFERILRSGQIPVEFEHNM